MATLVAGGEEFPFLGPLPLRPRVLDVAGAGDDLGGAVTRVRADAAGADVVARPSRLPFGSARFPVVRLSISLDTVDVGELAGIFHEARRVLEDEGVLHLALGACAPERESLVRSRLRTAGFDTVERRSRENDLFALLADGPQDGSRPLLLAARPPLRPHDYLPPLPALAFERFCRSYRSQHDRGAATFVVPVRDEARALPRFFGLLEAATNRTETDREFVFVLNGCTDDSAEVVERYASRSSLRTVVVTAAPGIVNAFRAGIAARSLDGYVGKLDSDSLLHPHALDLLQAHLTTQPELKVTYAEPVPSNAETPYGLADHRPGTQTRRRYFTGKASLYRRDPFLEPGAARVAAVLRAEDVFFSFYFAYFHGLRSMSPAPHAVVYHNALSSFDDLVRMVTRTRSEIGRVCATFPPFALLKEVFDQETLDPGYRVLAERAARQAGHSDEWLRLETTK